MCPATAPQGFPSSLLNSNCRDAMTLPYSHHSEASLLCYLFLFSYQHRVIHATVFQVLHASQFPQLVRDAPLLRPGGRSFSHVAPPDLALVLRRGMYKDRNETHRW